MPLRNASHVVERRQNPYILTHWVHPRRCTTCDAQVRSACQPALARLAGA
jgi:hypothetical protein